MYVEVVHVHVCTGLYVSSLNTWIALEANFKHKFHVCFPSLHLDPFKRFKSRKVRSQRKEDSHTENLTDWYDCPALSLDLGD